MTNKGGRYLRRKLLNWKDMKGYRSGSSGFDICSCSWWRSKMSSCLLLRSGYSPLQSRSDILFQHQQQHPPFRTHLADLTKWSCRTSSSHEPLAPVLQSNYGRSNIPRPSFSRFCASSSKAQSSSSSKTVKLKNRKPKSIIHQQNEEELDDTPPTTAIQSPRNQSASRKAKKQEEFDNNQELEDLPPTESNSNPTAPIESLYQKKTPIEHVLLRPDTYIGGTETIYNATCWVVRNSNNNSNNKRAISLKENCSYVPGLFKIYDEILVNAADNKQRDPKHMDEIRVDIDPGNHSL